MAACRRRESTLACEVEGNHPREEIMSAGDWRSVRRWTVCTVVLAGHLGALLLTSHHQSIQQRNLTGSPMVVVLFPQLEDSSAGASVGTKLRASRGRSTHGVTVVRRVVAEAAVACRV